jgi:uncharacterized RDD family membrane protein YckC
MNELTSKAVTEFMEDSGNHVIFKRLFAAIIDSLLWFLTLTIPDYLLGNELYRQTILIWLLLTYFLYFSLPEGLTGYTIGKFIFRVRVLGGNGKLPGLKAGAIRSFVRFFEGTFMFFPAAIVAVLSKRSQRLGDRIAHTYVMSSRNADLYLNENNVT